MICTSLSSVAWMVYLTLCPTIATELIWLSLSVSSFVLQGNILPASKIWPLGDFTYFDLLYVVSSQGTILPCL